MKELRRLLLITAATAGLALSLTGCSKNVDFLQYADVTFDGINGQATATVNVDYNKIGTDVFDKGKTQTDVNNPATFTKNRCLMQTTTKLAFREKMLVSRVGQMSDT